MALEELQKGRYRHLRLLGSGGMGEVYLMQDMRVNRRVAIKVLRAEEGSLYPDEEKATTSVRLFEREARAIAALDHPNILPLYDFGEETRESAAVAYMVMPYCAEGSLENWLRQRGGELLTPSQVAGLIEQAAEALHYAHEHKVVHLDVKPSNFLLRGNRKDPERPLLLLADFGIARNFTTISSSSRTIRGTPAAMSPEQWSGEPVFASDQYALAVMAYEMLVGRPPFTGTLEQLMYRHFTLPAPPPSSFNPRVPAALDEVLLRALAKKPVERFPTISDFASAFIQAAAQPAPAVAAQDELEDETSADDVVANLSQLVTIAGGQEVSVGVHDGAATQPVHASETVRPDDTLPVGLVERAEEMVYASAEGKAEKKEQREERSPAPAESRAEPAERQVETPPLRLIPEKSELVAAHNAQPTVVSLANEQQITTAPRPMPRRGRRALLAVAGLLIVLLLSGSLFYARSRQAPLSGAQATSTRVVQLTRTAQASPSTTPSPTIAPGEYIAGLYNGTMQDSQAQQTTILSVRLVQSNGSGRLQGSVTLRTSPQQVYPLEGSVDMQGNFSFHVQQPAGQLPLIFYGAVQPGSYLHGNYCHTAGNTCQVSEGYFTVGPRY